MEEREVARCGCCGTASRSCSRVLLCQLLVFSIVLLVAGLLLLICGAWLSQVSRPLILSGSMCASLALCLMGWLLVYIRCRNTSVSGKQVSATDGCSQETDQVKKSDFPMGPLVVLTLPTTVSPNPSAGKSVREFDSVTSTPDILGKSHKNNPPLASAETLTPSLLSSRGSVDSNL